MQLDSELTLEKAVKMVRQQEAFRQQQVDLQRPSTSQKVNQAKTAKVKAVSELDEEIGFLLGVSAVEDSSNLDDDEGECRRRWTAEIQVNGKQVKFKLDSQADVTCVPLCLFKTIMGQQRLVENNINLRAAEFSELQTVGMFVSTLRNGSYEIKERIYVIRRLSEPLLSRRACELLNLARRIEVVATKFNPIKEFPEVFEGLGQIGSPYEIKLKPGANPYAVHTPRRVPIPLMERLKTRLEELERAGIIARVNVATEWCAPTVIAGKPNGDIRLCMDLSRLNEHVQREVHPMPVVEHMLGQLGEAKFFSKLDANSGFHQIPLSPDCQHLTTFITPFGRYKFCRMPFGISLAPEYLQRVMLIILQGMDGVICYLDDILIFASDSKTHDRILRLVLRKLKEAKVTLNKAKCVFGVPRINFLGHILDEDGIRPDPAKIEAVAKMPAPTDVHGVRRFLGMVNHLGRFVKNLPEIVAPLNQLLVKGQDFVWDCSQERAFRKLKELLTTQPILAAYDVRKPTMVSSDASSYGLGAVLKQEGKNGIWRPVAYSSRTMTPTEKRYAQIEKEALANIWACERFQDFLLGKRFRIETDHKPLIPLFSTEFADPKTATFPNAYDEVWIRNSAYPWKGAARRRCIIQTTTSYNRGRIGMDLFKFENKWYLVVIDYYSRFPEMVQLDRLTANVVVRSCKSIFARHGIPETVVSDNGTQFGTAREFANFAKQYGFTHVTSSPRFPQSNGMAEAAVKIAKLILKKNQDPSLGLLEYRSTPLENGYSPAELLMGHKLRTTLPIAPENLNPRLLDSQTLKRKEERRRKDMKSRYDRRCGARDMEELSEGDTVWITDMRIWGILKQKASTPRMLLQPCRIQSPARPLAGEVGNGGRRSPQDDDLRLVLRMIDGTGVFLQETLAEGQQVCYNKTVGQVNQGDDYHFVGNIYENGQNSNDWKVYVRVDKIKMLFKMDTGSDVNIISQEIYFKKFAHKKLCKPDIQLLGPRQVKLHVMGKFTALIEKDGRSIPGEIFVVPQLMQPLLSGKASDSLNPIKRLQSIEKRNSLNPFGEYPKLFTGLGTLQGSYTIKLKDESQPHAIYTPRRIPIPLLNRTKEQLDQMVEKGVIEKVERPTDWCAPMVIVPKPSSNDLRICVDLTALNKTMSETEKRWAQIEKESLAIFWACERFQDSLMGNTFSIQTDHKLLILIFSTKNLDEMTPRIQRLRLRMMRYSYSIHHMPGKDIVVADALSRSPIKISHEKDLENEICSFVQQITSCPPFKDENMKEIWQYQNEKRECREIKDYCEKGWPTKNELSAEAKAFWFSDMK
ncbi:K02A2.6-like, partial [Cordylochernes scorpioides]